MLLTRIIRKNQFVRSFSHWAHLQMAPPDKILGLNESFKADQDKSKINLGVGAYRDDSGKPFVLNSVREAERRLLDLGLDKEYAGIAGNKAFTDLSLILAYGENNEILKAKKIAAVQSISGTGACRLAGEFVSKFYNSPDKTVYLSKPTWGNHRAIFKESGLNVKEYRYYDSAKNQVDFEGLLEDIVSAPDRSFFMLHACAHNPTGCDPSRTQWDELSRIMKEKHHLVFFDCAYQGFAGGNPDEDAYSIRKFVKDGHQIMLSQSFAKNFGLYGERVGLFSIVTGSSEEAQVVNSQLKPIARAMYSNPPIHGARIVAEILGDTGLRQQWLHECAAMAKRIKAMRLLLREKLESLSGGQGMKWNHITDQIGMFCYTGLSPEQVLKLRKEFHIYCTDDGRFSMAGINNHNIDYLANAVHIVTLSSKPN